MHYVHSLWYLSGIVACLITFFSFYLSTDKEWKDINKVKVCAWLIVELVGTMFLVKDATSVFFACYGIVFSAILTSVALTDSVERRIPNTVILPAMLVALAMSVYGTNPTQAVHLIEGGIDLGVVFGLFLLLPADWFGSGDWKLYTFIGLFSGAGFGLLIVVVSAMFGLGMYVIQAIGNVLKNIGKKERTIVGKHVAMGPPTLVAFFVCSIFYHQIAQGIVWLSTSIH